ncbi:MAG: ABC transporter permease [Desulfurococcus sp.]|nr:ABC transporter permease [Desulfurococcus sp.]
MSIRGFKQAFRRQLRRTRFTVGLVITSIMVLIAILASLFPFILPYPEEGLGYVPPGASSRTLLPPNPSNFFGTDTRGRDLFSRIILGARSAIIEIVVVVSISLSIGVIVGVLASYYRGLLEYVLNYATELLMSIPAVVIALMVRLISGPGLHVVLASLIVTWWPWYARVSQVYSRSIVEMDYVVLAKLSGLSNLKIIYRHVIRNTLPPVLVQAVTDMGSVLLEAASINFLGLGVPLNSPEWGVIMLEGLPVITRAPWISLFPGFFLLITALGFSLIGDSLREELDPRVRRRWRLWF